MSKKHMGSSIDGLLKEEGIFEEAQAQAIREVVAWQLKEAMKKARRTAEHDNQAGVGKLL
jgi:antitoxin HicB